MDDIKLKLEKFTESDFPNYFELVGNERVMEMITERAIESDEALRDFEKIILNNSIDENFGYFKILDEITQEFLGLAKLTIKGKNDQETELGYMILPKHWGRGIASKVVKQLIENTRKQELTKKLFAIIDPKNLASRKVLTNNGFVSKEFNDIDGLTGEILELHL